MTQSHSNEITTRTKSLGERELMVMMAAIMALSSLATDSMLPAFPAMVAGLGVHPFNNIQYVITVYLLGTGIGSLFYGPISDRYGRRPILLGAMLGYMVFTLACSFASSFPMLIAMRFLHGFCSAALGVIAISVVRDKFSGDAMAQRMSMIFLIFMIIPIIAPTLGQAILWIAGWREIFDLMAFLGLCVCSWVYFRLPETRDPAHITPMTIDQMMLTARAVVINRTAAGYMGASAMVQGSIFAFLNSSQPIIDQSFGQKEHFALYFAIVSIGIASSNLGNARIVERFGARRVSQTALLMYIFVAILQLLAAIYAPHNLPLFLGLLTANMAMLGFIGSNFSSIAMQPFGKIAGAASSFQTFMRTVIAAFVGSAIGQQFNGTAVPLATGYCICGITAFALVAWCERGKMFTRPGTTTLLPL